MMPIKSKDFPVFGRQEAPAVFSWLTDVIAWGPLVIETGGQTITRGAHFLRKLSGGPRLSLQWVDGDDRDHVISFIEDARRIGDGVEITTRHGVLVVRPTTEQDMPNGIDGEPFVQWFNRQFFSEW